MVEDYPANSFIACTLLESIGYSSDLAVNGREAVDFAARRIYNLILMDVEMPVFDGYRATRLIRNYELDHKLEAIPIIGMTAHGFMEDREKCLAAGMDDYISKPFNFTEFEAKLGYWLQKKMASKVA